MLIQVSKEEKVPVFTQLVEKIRELIEAGAMPEGYRLPSTRQMAVSLGINRSTVVRAFNELWALGYLESTPGSYTCVRKRKKITGTPSPGIVPERWGDQWFAGGQAFDFTMMDRYAQLMSEAGAGIVDFYHLVPDMRLLDKRQVSESFREALNCNDCNVFGYNHPRGLPQLREVVLNHMRLHSIHAGDENILITNGSQNSLQLVFQAFASRGDVIAIESPTYAMLFPLIRYYGLEVAEVPCGPDGMDLDTLSAILLKRNIRFIYTMPSFQNPTGATMPQESRERLLGLCERFQMILIEDSIEEEMKYFGRVHLPIKSMDHHGQVIYLGSFSKVLAPGMRTAWVIAPANCIERMTAVKTMSDLSSNTLSQLMLYHFCKSGYYELHIRRMMRIFRKRMKTALRLLRQHMPQNRVSWDEPLGGFLIWLHLHCQTPTDLENYFLSHGVRITDGRLFFFTAASGCYIRISISKCNDAEIAEGIRRLADAIRRLPD